MVRDDPKLSSMLPTSNRPQNAGASINDDASRIDAVLKVTGRAKYGRDRYFANGLYVAFIRCPYGAAELAGMDKDAAMAVPGVIEVEITSNNPGSYHGQNVGHLVAESPHAMRRGMRALKPQWKRQEVKTTIDESVAGDEAAPAAVVEALSGADHVIEASYSAAVQTHVCLETHGSSVDHRGDSATVYCSTQGTFAARDGVEKVIGLPSSQWELVCEFVGGGFGSKLNGAGKEGALAATIAGKYKRPTYLFVNRAEDHLDTGNRPSCRADVKVGVKNDGSIVAGYAKSWGGVGVGRGGGGMSFPSGRYNLKLERAHEDVRFNGGGPRPARAPGAPQGAFVEELLLEEIATALKTDPLEYRKKLVRMEHGREMLDLGAEWIGWKNRKPTGSQTGAIRRGMACGLGSWHSGGTGAEAEVVINRDGSIEARTGSQDIGTGQRTTMGAIVAHTLGVSLDLVAVRIGSSNLPSSPASGGSVTVPSTAPPMIAAAAEAKGQLLTMLAEQNGLTPADLDIKNGVIVKGGSKFMEWSDACAKIAGDRITGRSGPAPNQGKGHSNGAQFVDLDVDTETGVIHVREVVAVQACGKTIFRKGAESQIIGGVIQGLSYALFENKLLDRNTGAMVNPNLEWYKILGPNDMPHIVPILWRLEQEKIGSMGEPPIVATAGAVAAAVLNAIGRPVRSLPITPDKVLAALEGGAR